MLNTGIFPKAAAVVMAIAGFLGPFKAIAAESPLPLPLKWTSSGILISPVSDDAHKLVSVKDPTAVHFGGKWHVYVLRFLQYQRGRHAGLPLEVAQGPVGAKPTARHARPFGPVQR